MRKRTVLGWSAAGVLLLSAMFSVHADDAALLIELDPRSEALPTAVSPSGAMVVGGLNGAGGFYWMPTTGVIFAGGMGANGVSGDGLLIAGIARDSRGIRNAAIWQRATEWKLLGSFGPSATPCDTSLSSAYGVSRDGQVVVGSAFDTCSFSHAFRWQATAGMVDLGSSVAGRSSLAAGVSGDGNVVVGSQTDAGGFLRGVRWVNGRQEVIPGADGFVSSAYAANLDGSIVVGRICRPVLDDQSAWVWTAQGGTTCLPAPRKIPSPGPVIIVEANATSDDGQVIGGSQNVGGSVDSEAVLWIGGRPAYLKDFLQANGVPDAFRTWVNTGTITGISPDGRILVGWGAARQGFQGYIVILGSSRVIP